MLVNVFKKLFATSSGKNRFLEIDALRGIAMLMVIVFHLLFDLNYFGIASIGVSQGFLWWFARVAAFLFIFLVGVSASIAFMRNAESYIQHAFTRGIKVLLWGLLITLATFLLLPEGTIWFGILHFIGISIVLSVFFMRFNVLNVVIGIAFIAIGLHVLQLTAATPWLLWLGLQPSAFYSFDYFPLLPWFGVVLLGMYFGKHFYCNHKSPFNQNQMNALPGISMLAVLGRHSLFIYLLHQPLLIFLLFLLGFPLPFF